MIRFRQSRLLQITGLLFAALVWLASNSNPTTGRTGAPFDGGVCNDCHTGSNPNNYNGTVTVSGLPGTIEPNTTYPLTLEMTPTGGTPVRGGFQLVVVDGNNANAGDLITVNTQSGTDMFGGREYLEHRGGKTFPGGTGAVSWVFNWKSPASAAGNTIKLYFIGNFTNGNGGTSGDFPITFNDTYAFAGAPPVSASITSTTNVSCFGGNNGSATVEASGGNPPYTYLWSNGQTSETAVNLTAGTYTVTVTAVGGGGVATATATITQPSLMTLSATSSNSINCFQPTATLTATAGGGVGSYTYDWSNGDSGNAIQVTQIGNYQVTATDGNGCTKIANVSVQGNTTPPTAVANPAPQITCQQTQVTLSGAGSSTGNNFTYIWTTTNGNIVSGSTTLSPAVSSAGTYTLTVTNTVSGCTASASATVTTNTTAPTASATGGTLNCTQTSTTLNAATNASQPSYLWTGPGINSSNDTLQNPMVTLPGAYSVQITNTANGCTNSASTSVTVDTLYPSVSAGAGQITCADTAAVITVSTNASQAAYTWTGPGGFTSSQANDTIQTPGQYIVQVTNTANGCSAADTVQVLQNTAPPLAGAAPPANLNCNNAAVQINGLSSSQGTNFTYSWTTTTGNIVSGANTLLPVVDTIGLYTLVVTNTTNGCTADTAVQVNQTPAVTASVGVVVNVSCFGGANGSATVTTGGGAGTFSYAWSNGDSTAAISNLPAGVYAVTVSDVENCTASAQVTIAEPTILSANASATGETAANANDGTATASPSGGTTPYTYLWNNNFTTAAITNLAPGNYSVTVTDANDCTAVQTVTVNSFNCQLSAGIASTNVTCNGAANGTATVSLGGAADPVTYAWSTGANTSNVSNLAPGNYTVSITDGNGCPAVLSVTIIEPAALSTNATATPETALNANDGTATAQPTGGTQPYDYLWNNDSTSATITNLAPGSYSVTIQDGNGCTATQTVTVLAFNCNLASTVTAIPVVCPTDSTGQATVAVSGGTSPFTYLWSNGATGAAAGNLPVGAYTVTITDDAGCEQVQSAQIVSTDSLAPTLNCPASVFSCIIGPVNYAPPAATDNCDLTGIAPTLTAGLASGANFPVGITQQTYLITDASGNTAQCSFTVEVAVPLSVALDTVINDQNGAGVGAIRITASGGTGGPYEYEWRKNGFIVSTSEDPGGLTSGLYELTLIDPTTGCAFFLFPVAVDNTVGAPEPGEDISLRVLPNPASAYFRLEWKNLEPVAVQILDSNGRLVRELGPDECSEPITLQAWPQGLYLVQVVDALGRRYTERVVVY